jgi:hypothetical protein
VIEGGLGIVSVLWAIVGTRAMGAIVGEAVVTTESLDCWAWYCDLDVVGSKLTSLGRRLLEVEPSWWTEPEPSSAMLSEWLLEPT